MGVGKTCCDLLSISVLNIFEYNTEVLNLNILPVVICFQFQFLIYLNTTLAQYHL